MPNDIDFPFIMLAYTPNPRPKKIHHPNGIKGVEKILVGRENLDIHLLNELLPNQSGLKLTEGKGVQTVTFIDSDLKIEEILQKLSF